MSHVENCRGQDYFRDGGTYYKKVESHELTCSRKDNKRHEQAFKSGKPGCLAEDSACHRTWDIAHSHRSTGPESVSETSGDLCFINVSSFLYCINRTVSISEILRNDCII